jgi:peroxiredoxin
MEFAVKSFWMCLVLSLVAVAGIAVATEQADADVGVKLPSFEMKDLNEVQHRLSDERFEGKTLVIVAFGTWQQTSIQQARELERFHQANPDIEIIAFVVDNLGEARDFVAREGLSFPCYRADGGTRIRDFHRLFRTRRGKTLTLNRVPFVVVADETRSVTFAEIGVVTADTLADKLP